MRRLAAVFRRSDRSDAGSNASTVDHGSTAGSSKMKSSVVKSRSGLFRGLTRSSLKDPDSKARKHSVPQVSTLPPDHAASSASSSSGTTPTTPSDEQESVGHHNHGKKAWMHLEKTIAHGVLPSTAPLADPQHRPYLPHRYVQDQDDASSIASNESPDEAPPPPPKPSNTSSPPLSPIAYFRVITTNALALPFSPPPLLNVPSSPLYPRSSNPSRQLAPSESLRVRMHRKQLLARLALTDPQALAAFSQRHGVPARSKRLSLILDDVALKRGQQVSPFSQGLRRWAERPCFEDRVIIYLPNEHGETGVHCEGVSSSTAVEALGYSEELELLAALDEGVVLDEAPVQDPVFTPSSLISLTPDLSLTPSTASLSSVPPSPLMTGSTPSLTGTNTKTFPSTMYKAAPSPLRIESTDAVPRLPPIPSPRSISTPSLTVHPASLTPGMSSSRTSPAISPSAAPGARPAVHFADDDKDESVPLDYVMRVKQARDQKAKFLAAERARRMEDQTRGQAAKRAQDDRRQLAEERKRLEDARKKHEEERRKQDLERKRLDQERAAFERERRAADDEKKQRLIHEELIDARRRRESHRSGPVPKSNEGAVAWEGDREKEREKRMQEARGSYSRPKYDDAALPVPKRISSEPNVNLNANLSSSPSSRPGTVAFANSSPGSSRPASLVGSQRGSSRPPSMYSTPPSSSSDIRVRRESKASRRTSFVSDSAYTQPQMFFQPGTPPGAMQWMVPPVPPLPVTNVMPVAVPMMMPMQMQMGMGMQMSPGMGMMPYSDMPLLPPAPPFMMGQRSHGSGQRSHSASPTRGRDSKSGSDREAGSTHGRDSPAHMHRRRPSGEASAVASGSRSPQPPPDSQYATVRSSRSGYPASQRQQQQQQQVPSSFQRPVPVSNASYSRQPGFENLSRPQGNRRQTMIT